MPPADAQHPAIRIASFNLARFDESRLDNARIREVLVQLLPRFDLIALQEIRAPHQGALVRLVEQLNAGPRQYDFATSPEVALKNVQQFSAFVFDRATIEVDRSQVYQVDDRTGRFERPPLVGAFRTRGPSPAEAFTFTLINVDLEPDRTPSEGQALADVFRAVRHDGRNEDDVIIVGTVNLAGPDLARLEESVELMAAITSAPTTTRGTRIADNILFDRRATTEFSGRAGVIDLIREFGLTMQEALEVSEHLPVWAEFSCFEGGQPGQIPAVAGRAPR
jgi:endonuclease/exonuclease/phosphatase family metal-dependent hydrolase